MVNRVWAWHFGKPLVATLSDFGLQGERRRIRNCSTTRCQVHCQRLSLKWLHREIALSGVSTASQPARCLAADQINPSPLSV